MLDGLIETINWLSITVPFILAGASYVTLTDEWKWNALLASALAFLILATSWIALYYLHLAIGFPLWMVWPCRWLGQC
jgi:hypothetical protein